MAIVESLSATVFVLSEFTVSKAINVQIVAPHPPFLSSVRVPSAWTLFSKISTKFVLLKSAGLSPNKEIAIIDLARSP